MNPSNNKPESMKTHLLKNKWKILLLFIGYILFVANKDQVNGIVDIFSSFNGIVFSIIYISMVLITYFYVKISLHYFIDLTMNNKNKVKNLTNGFLIISMGSFLGFLTNGINALIIVTFSKYIVA